MYIIIGFSLLKDITQDSLAKDMLKCPLLYCLYKCTLSTLIYVLLQCADGRGKYNAIIIYLDKL